MGARSHDRSNARTASQAGKMLTILKRFCPVTDAADGKRLIELLRSELIGEQLYRLIQIVLDQRPASRLLPARIPHLWSRQLWLVRALWPRPIGATWQKQPQSPERRR